LTALEKRYLAMTKKVRVIVHMDADGAKHVDVHRDGELDVEDPVASKRSEPIAHFGDDEFKASQHIRHGGY